MPRGLKRAWSFIKGTAGKVFPGKEPTVSDVVGPLLKRGALVESVSPLQGSGKAPRRFTASFFFPPGFEIKPKDLNAINKAIPHPLVSEKVRDWGAELGFATRARHETADAVHRLLVSKAKEHAATIAEHRKKENSPEDEPD